MDYGRLGVFERPDIPGPVLQMRCSRILAALGALGDAELVAALGDPRGLHKSLYHDFAPTEAPELAGNYRGADFPSLRDYVVAFSFNEAEGTTEIVGPHKVAESMERYASVLRGLDLATAPTREAKIGLVATVMTLFGAIHPFIDGNGHVQRITAQALLQRAGLQMAPRWRVHPCPYGEDVHRALAYCRLADVAALIGRFVEG
jgi:hypothetical protein